MAESALASQPIENVHFRHQFAAGDHEVGNVRSIGRQIGRGASHRKKFSKSRLRIFEVVAERSQAEAERSWRETQLSCNLRAEPTTLQQSGIADALADQRLPQVVLQDFERGES